MIYINRRSHHGWIFERNRVQCRYFLKRYLHYKVKAAWPVSNAGCTNLCPSWWLSGKSPSWKSGGSRYRPRGSAQWSGRLGKHKWDKNKETNKFSHCLFKMNISHDRNKLYITVVLSLGLVSSQGHQYSNFVLVTEKSKQQSKGCES